MIIIIIIVIQIIVVVVVLILLLKIIITVAVVIIIVIIIIIIIIKELNMALNLEPDSSKRTHSQAFAETRYKYTHNNVPTVGLTDE